MSAEDPLHILVICTANICRSPFTAGLLERSLGVLGAPATVSSAGFLTEGQPACDTMVKLAAARGVRLGAHRSRRVTDDIVAAADLIVVMERRHGRDLVVRHSADADRVFTLGHLGQLLAAHPPAAGQPLTEWLAVQGPRRGPGDLLGDRRDDEVGDPHGRSERVHRRTADDLAALVRQLAAPLGGFSRAS